MLNDQSGAKTNGVFTKVNGALANSLEFNKVYSLTTSFRFQKALNNKNLDSSQVFSLGGAYGVRAFPDGEYSSDNGYLIGAELFGSLPKFRGISNKVSIFADTGYASRENPTVSPAGRQLSDLGFGYQADFKEFFLKAQIARVIGSEKSETEDKEMTRLLLQMGWTY